jgi:hypothetical protein
LLVVVVLFTEEVSPISHNSNNYKKGHSVVKSLEIIDASYSAHRRKLQGQFWHFLWLRLWALLMLTVTLILAPHTFAALSACNTCIEALAISFQAM